MINQYESDYGNQVHHLSVSVSKHIYITGARVLKFQKKPFELALTNVGSAERAHIVHYLVRDHFSGAFYGEICSSKELKLVLDGIRDELRRRDYLPMMVDFEKPQARDTIETVSTLAHMARFVIADLTDAKSVLQELQQIGPALPSVPIQPLLHDSQDLPGMIDHLKGFASFLEIY